MCSKKVSRPSKKFQSRVAEKLSFQMEGIYLLAQINTALTSTSSTLLRILQNSNTKDILVKLDVSNGLMMILVLFQVVGTEVSSCGNSTLIKVLEEMVM